MKTIWTASYEGNTITIENTWFHGERLYVNEKLQDQKVGVFTSNLTGHLFSANRERKFIKVHISGITSINCHLFVDDEQIALTKIR